jgi:pimeloyl-ACP methyl ester carboxylesterase
MTSRSCSRGIRILTLILSSTVLACETPSADSTVGRQPARTTAAVDPALTALGPHFKSDLVAANGTRLHVVRGGQGPAVILLHGWPQDWSAWRRIMPELSKGFTTIAVDLRGVGGSDEAESGFDEVTMARDIHDLLASLHVTRPLLVGYDIGAYVAYAYARLYPSELRGGMLVDVPLPGLEPWDQVERDPRLWHFHFHATPELPEQLVAGREELYFQNFVGRLAFRKDAVTKEDIAHYARSYSRAKSLHAGFEFYRQFTAAAEFNRARQERLDVPLILVGGDKATAPISGAVAESLRKQGATQVVTEVIHDSGHFVPEEQPQALADLIKRHAR